MAQLDPNIILKATNQVATPSQQVSDVAAAQNNQAVAQQNQIKTQQMQQGQQDDAALRQAIQGSGGDLEKALPQIMAHNPMVGLKLQEAIRAQREALIKYHTDQAEAAGREAGALMGLSPEARPAAVAGAKQRLQAIGIDPSSIPDPADPQFDSIVGQMRTRATSAKDQADNLSKELVAKSKNPTEASIALQAAGGDPAKALELLQKNKSGTSEQDDQRYRNIQAARMLRQPVPPADAAWAAGYEKQKTLGPEASAAAAANRQAATIDQQTAQQARSQAFAEGQAGRREYTDKVATPYQTAMASAQTMRDTVAAAQGGNKIAGNLQNLETTMAAIRAQGLNRINTTEIGVAANAGSLWDRIQGRVGALTAGQPVPADLQKDMLQFADILEKSATAKYQKGRKSILQVYPSANVPDESVTSGPKVGDTKTFPNGSKGVFDGQGWVKQ